MLQNRVNQCRSEQQELEMKLRNIETRKIELQQELNTVKSQKSQLESDLATEKIRCNKLKEKLERLKTAYRRVESDLRCYVSAAQNFENRSKDISNKNLSSIDKCISYIEEYLST